jgi:energy-coupling factor transporter ATP-binding protein EcfA2
MNALEIVDLSFQYADGMSALSGVSFHVAPEECLGLIGPNGAGKSTLLMHLNGLLPERIGDASPVRVFGEPIGRRNLDRIRREVGLLFQNPDDQLFSPTVFEDVSFGPRQFGWSDEAVRTVVARAMEQVGLPEYGPRSPHHLSHGEKRRVCIAGLLACEPRVVLLDEPTSDLDPRGRRELKTLLRRLPVTKVIASHDLELIAELCSRVLILDRGRVVREGPAFELLNDEALMLEHGLERPHGLRPTGRAAG